MARRSNPQWAFDPSPLERVRAERGLTATALGRLCNPPMAGTHILDIETRRRTLTVRTLLRLCETFSLAPGEFFVAKK